MAGQRIADKWKPSKTFKLTHTSVATWPSVCCCRGNLTHTIGWRVGKVPGWRAVGEQGGRERGVPSLWHGKLPLENIPKKYSLVNTGRLKGCWASEQHPVALRVWSQTSPGDHRDRENLEFSIIMSSIWQQSRWKEIFQRQKSSTTPF